MDQQKLINARSISLFFYKSTINQVREKHPDICTEIMIT